MSGGEHPFGDLLQDYIVECLPLAEQVGDAFVELERRWRAGEPGDDLLTTVKGRLHTIKGNSAMMGLTPMRDVAHALEDTCGFLGRAAGARTDDAAALLVAGGGLLVGLVGAASPETDPGPAAEFVERVRGYLAAAPGAAGPRSERRQTERRGLRGTDESGSTSAASTRCWRCSAKA
jgi:chemotaxis protein histidine kinase CheA